MVLIGIAGLALFNGCGPRRALTISADVDGSDVVKVSGNKLWIEHEDFQLPKRIIVNDKVWIPQWTTNVSAPFEGLQPPFAPRDPGKSKYQKRPDAGPSPSRRGHPPKTIKRWASGLTTMSKAAPIVIPFGLPGDKEGPERSLRPPGQGGQFFAGLGNDCKVPALVTTFNNGDSFQAAILCQQMSAGRQNRTLF